MEARCTEIYRETGTLDASERRVGVEALEWSADHYGEHYEINAWIRNRYGDRAIHHETWLLRRDGVVIKGRADVQRMAIREFDKLMSTGQPDGEELREASQEQYVAQFAK